jgi:hypothetical protein
VPVGEKMKAGALQPAAMTVIFTPNLVKEFGRAFLNEDTADTALDVYTQALQTSFKSTARAKSVPEFEERWSRGIVRYAKIYDVILRSYIERLGPSHFRSQYIKSITQTQSDFQKLSIAVHDLSDLYQRHVADSINIATNYDEIFRNNEPQKVDRVNALLRESNYGITLLYLLLSGEVPGPLWVILKAKDRTHESLAEIERTFKLPTESRLSGSLEGDFDFFLDPRRR